MTQPDLSIEVVFDRLPELRASTPVVVDRLVGKAAFDFVGLVRRQIVAQGLVDTGFYLNSWTAVKLGQGSWSAFSNVFYGPYLNYGTRFMAARPHVEPAVDQVRTAFVGVMTRLENYL